MQAKHESTSRRALLKGTTATAAIAVLPIAAMGPAAAGADPIFAAIAEHRRAHQAFVAVIDGTDDDDPARDVASDAADNVAIELLNVTPATVAGVTALLQYGYEFEAAGNWWPGDIETEDEPEPRIDSSHKWHVLMFKHAANALDKIA